MELVIFMVRTMQTGMKLASTIRKINGPMLAVSRFSLSFRTKSAILEAILSETVLTLSWYCRKSTAYPIRSVRLSLAFFLSRMKF